jgi:hypothetical protein
MLSYARAPFVAALLIGGSLAALAAVPGAPAAPPAPDDVPAVNPPVADAPEPPQPTWQARKPATQPVAEAKLQTWFNDLAASDAAVRDAALGALLELTRAELPGLRQVVERSRPVAPSQAHALRDVVNHVFLSGETYPAEPRVGFLGLVIPTLDSVEVPRGAAAAEPPEPNAIVVARASTGVPIEYRIPGFCAFRALREGDVVLSITKPNARRLRDWNELTYSIRAYPAGESIALEVLRQGAVLSVPVTLDAKPLVPQEEVWHNVILPNREAAAQAYWNEHFAPLVEERVSTSAADGSAFHPQ